MDALYYCDSIEKTPTRPKKLPEFKGFTVDERLREFRKVAWKEGEPGIEYVPFDSRKGSKMLKDLLRKEVQSVQTMAKWKGRLVDIPDGPGDSLPKGS